MTTSRKYRVASIPGDGIGREVVPAAQQVVDAAGRQAGFAVDWHEYDWSCDRYLRTGAMMPKDGIATLSTFDAILIGAVGAPTVPDHVSLWGLLIPVRRSFRQYINLRPVQLLPGLVSPVRALDGKPFDLVIVRENVEGEYSQVGGLVHDGDVATTALQTAVFTRAGSERVLRYGFELAAKRRGRVTVATKSNGITVSMPFWDDIARAVAADFPAVKMDLVHVDALAAKLVLSPQSFDVIVGTNLFGDILSDLAAAVAGSLGIAPSASLNPERAFPSMFEPVHGSAPDIAGKGIANPIAAIWSAAMMLEHLGEAASAAAIFAAICRANEHPSNRTPDLGGSASTRSAVDAVLASLDHGASH